MFRFGVSTACLYPMNVAESVEKICALKPPVCEIFMNSIGEMDNSEIVKIKELLKSSGTELISFHPFTAIVEGLLFFSGYKRRIEDGLELYKRYFHAASLLGAKYFVFHGERDHATFGQTMIDEDSAFLVYEKLCNAAQNEGVLFTQENVAHFRSQNPDFLRNMKNALGKNIGFTFDIKQAYRANANPIKLIDAMGDRLVHFHINDFSAEKECCLPGSGSVDYGRIFEKLSEIGYVGDFVLEVYKKNFGEICDLKKNILDFNSQHPIKKNFVIDRFEENFAILEDSQKRCFDISKSLLPQNAHEGCHITNTNGFFSVDMQKTSVSKSSIKQKISKLFE